MNEMPVTDTSKKVRNVIKRRQQDGKWICSVPYGYVFTKAYDINCIFVRILSKNHLSAILNNRFAKSHTILASIC